MSVSLRNGLEKVSASLCNGLEKISISLSNSYYGDPLSFSSPLRRLTAVFSSPLWSVTNVFSAPDILSLMSLFWGEGWQKLNFQYISVKGCEIFRISKKYWVFLIVQYSTVSNKRVIGCTRKQVLSPNTRSHKPLWLRRSYLQWQT